MEIDVRYKGYTANTSDYDAPDGDLALSLNVGLKAGTLKPMLLPKQIIKLDEEEHLVYIDNDRYIYYGINSGRGGLYWKNNEGKEHYLFSNKNDEGIYNYLGLQFQTLGNVLVLIDRIEQGRIFYFLWTGEDYKYLGQHLPEINLSFGLQRRLGLSSSCELQVGVFLGTDYSESPVLDDTKVVTVLGYANKLIAEATSKGYFIYPFFVRYAYRLYDGSLIMHSAPVLMIPCSAATPRIDYQVGTSVVAELITKSVFADIFSLDFAVTTEDEIANIQALSEIIQSVDIFISAPIYTYNQSKNTLYYGEYSTFGYYKEPLANADYKQHITSKALALSVVGFTKDEILEKIKNTSTFYFLKSIKLDELSTERKIINIQKNHLTNLLQQEVMSDCYQDHDILRAKYQYIYNSRLNVANITRKLFGGYSPSALFTHVTTSRVSYNDNTQQSLTFDWVIFVFIIRENNKEYIVMADKAEIGNDTPLYYFYYPNIHAYKAVLIQTEGYTDNSDGARTYALRRKIEIILEPHPFLNGAYYARTLDERAEVWSDIDGSGPIPDSETNDIPTPTAENTISDHGKIFSSEVDNPFLFLPSNINTIQGEIIGLASATQAISQGQFGQFPLYAFTDNGIWTLNISPDSGKFISIQPVSREVCVEPNSITQIDNAVLFISQRGIIMLAGAATKCISDELMPLGDNFDLSSLPNIDRFTSDLIPLPIVSFRTYLGGARMIYDYKNRELIVYNGSDYSYVYQFETMTWGISSRKITFNIPRYTEALAEIGNAVFDFSERQTEKTVSIFIITRPLKLDAPDVFKTIHKVIQRGVYSEIKQILYGSNDLIHWHTVWSSTNGRMQGFRGTPYKYYRIAVFGDMTSQESISAATIVYNHRLTNQVR
jgi:hypothetical protein|nr:MAG TPA_asm: stabilization protein [Caudoviricetes sp.]